MRIFYKERTGHLIVTPFRCGSSYLQKSLEKYELTTVKELPDTLMLGTDRLTEKYEHITSKIKKKTFIYRDPFKRWVSLYHYLIYIPRLYELNTYKTKLGAIVSRKKNNYFTPPCYNYLIQSFDETKSFWENAHTATKLLEEAIKNTQDYHILPQYIFFDEYFSKIKSDESEVVDLKDYTSWINATFDDNLEHDSNSEYINIKLFELHLVNEIRSICGDIYYNDHEYILPLTDYI